MNVAIIEFFVENVRDNEFKAKRILEVGSKYVNGSIRPFIERLHPTEYLGVDIELGKHVNVILSAENLVEYFGSESFDVVIATELLEHVKNWRLAISNMKEVLKRSGYMYVTTRSYGFHFHSYPFDYWRYGIEDIHRIFSDFKILILKEDPQGPRVFLKAIKLVDYKPNNLRDIALYSMILGKRTTYIPEICNMPLLRRLKLSVKEAYNTIKGKFYELLVVS